MIQKFRSKLEGQTMSLDVTLLKTMPIEVFEANITHNLCEMAEAAGIYKHLWRPDEIGITKAGELISHLEEGLDYLENNPDYCKTFNPENGWGSYESLVTFVKEYLASCKANPDAEIEISR